MLFAQSVRYFLTPSPQLHEVVYAKWDETNLYYLAQVMSINPCEKTYDLHYMDGYEKNEVPQRQIRKIPAREKKKQHIGKTFFDSGDYEPGKRHTKDIFPEGEFLVLCYQPGTTPSYWCERQTNIKKDGKREIVSFFCTYVSKRIALYDKK